MTTDIKELVRKIRAAEWHGDDDEIASLPTEAADALEAMAAERDRLKELYDAGCKQWNPVFKVVLDERDRLKAIGQKLLAKFDHPTAVVTQWDVDELRKALGGDA